MAQTVMGERRAITHSHAWNDQTHDARILQVAPRALRTRVPGNKFADIMHCQSAQLGGARGHQLSDYLPGGR